MSNSIRFDGDYGSSAFEQRMTDALRQGKLPGHFGLLQELVGHWAFRNDEHTWVRLGKAVLDSVGSVLSYREASREVVEGKGSPSTRWLKKQGYTVEFAAESRGLGSFVRGALNGLEFSDRQIRAEIGELDRRVLKGFSLGGDRVAYLLDPWGGEQVNLRGTETQSWVGPYCRPEDLEELKAFVRERIWRDRLKTDTLLLDVAEPGQGDDVVRISAVTGDFDFASAHEAFNDVGALARRCGAFVLGGRSRRLMFHGPPGTGKSTLARAIARELGARTVLLAHEATSQLSDSTVVQILALLEPGVLVLNDVDRSSEHEALALLHGLESMVDYPLITVLTANDVEALDPAVLRPGRVDEVREVPEPNRESRAVILEHYAQQCGFTLSPALREIFLDRSDGFSPADVREFAETAQAVGLDVAMEELERIAEQRQLYAGDRCEEFNQRPHQRVYRPRRRRA